MVRDGQAYADRYEHVQRCEQKTVRQRCLDRHTVAVDDREDKIGRVLKYTMDVDGQTDWITLVVYCEGNVCKKCSLWTNQQQDDDMAISEIRKRALSDHRATMKSKLFIELYYVLMHEL